MSGKTFGGTRLDGRLGHRQVKQRPGLCPTRQPDKPLGWGSLTVAQTGMQRLAGGCSLSPLALLVLTILSTDLCLCQPKSVGAFHFFFIALCPQPESPKENSLWCTTVELTLFFHCILDSNAPPFPSCLPCMHLLFHI